MSAGGTNGRALRPFAIAVVLYLLAETWCGAEDHFDYKFEYYAEEKDRIHVSTHTALFEQSLSSWLALRGSVVYDGISGATPKGGPPPAGSRQVALEEIDDTRYAGTLETDFRFGRHTLRASLALSYESDYESVAPSLNYLVDFNQRNTTLQLGVAHNFDRITDGIYIPPGTLAKDSTDFLIGFTQVLTPKTLFNATLTLGTADGYLSDPYKGFRFSGYPDPDALFPEKRPGHRTKQIFSVSLSQFIERLNGSPELTYRFYHDSFGLFAHTATVEWFQKFGKQVVVAPLFRYYEQAAADFYRLSFDADPSDPDNPNNALVPQFYSSDYRLSKLRTLTYGVSTTVRVRKWLALDAAYKRYEMLGLDGATAASNYPKANIWTVGLRLNY
jgi:hypothetical protein